MAANGMENKKRFFNTTGCCDPKRHYMVDIRQRLAEIRKLVDAGEYFTINRARQYGKTTTIKALMEYLKPDYIVISLDFQMIGNEEFADGDTFARAFAGNLTRITTNRRSPLTGLSESTLREMSRESESGERFSLGRLFYYLSELCDTAEKPIVMIIDEVDSAANNQVFLDFLAQLRAYYLKRDTLPTFQSVILAGVYDVKNIRHKIQPKEDHKVNSPWNIAADFTVNMSFHRDEIQGMLEQYEQAHGIGMDAAQIAGLIYDATSGYPFLVSRLCKLIDENVTGTDGFQDEKAAWTREGFLEAEKLILSERNTLFESLVEKLTSYPELRDMIYALLFQGKDIPYNALNPYIDMASMFGFVKNNQNRVAIANRTFETILYNYFLSEEIVKSRIYDAALQDRNQFLTGGRLNMRLVLEKFVEAFSYLYGDQNERFLEEEGRKYFMLFLKPIINGVGHSYVESRTRNLKRTDMIIDYRGEQFVVELKLWREPKYHAEGEEQIREYLEYYHLQIGYMLTFNFNKTKEIGVKEIRVGDRVLVEAIV